MIRMSRQNAEGTRIAQTIEFRVNRLRAHDGYSVSIRVLDYTPEGGITRTSHRFATLADAHTAADRWATEMEKAGFERRLSAKTQRRISRNLRALWRDRSVKVNVATLNRAAVDTITAYATARGYRAHETNLLDVDGTVSVTLTGHGEVCEVLFRPNLATGFLRFDHGNWLFDVSASRLRSARAVREQLDSAAGLSSTA